MKNWPLYRLAFKDYAGQQKSSQGAGLPCLRNSVERDWNNIVDITKNTEEAPYDRLQFYLDWDVLTYRIKKGIDEKGTTFNGIIDKTSVYILMNSGDNNAHRLHLPSESTILCFRNIYSARICPT